MQLINNRYQLLDKLGEGGMGEVFQTRDRLTSNIIALKRVIVSPSQLAFNSVSIEDDDYVALANEFQTLASMWHPHIINVIDYGFEENGTPYFTMPLIENPHTIVSIGKQVDIKARILLIIQLLQALAYLHRQGIVHRDLKPANVLVENGEQVFVLDFGLAVDHKNERQAAGTIYYMAPEVLRGNPASFASDLYAVGVMGMEILTGSHPFMHQEVSKAIHAILFHNPDLKTLKVLPTPIEDRIGDEPNYSAPLEQIFGRLLAKNPEDRYQTADSVIEALTNVINEPVKLEDRSIRESFLQSAKFVGRETQKQKLVDALATTQQHQGQMWLIGGESGVGKTRLLNEIRIQALVQGIKAVSGQGVTGGGLAYQLWRDVLPHLILDLEISDEQASILLPLTPTLPNLLGRPIQPAPVLQGDAEQQRLILAIIQILESITKPTLIIFEDLQWTSESLLPLKALSERLPHIPLLIIGSYRNDEKADLPEQLPSASTMILPRLSEDDIAALSVSMLGETGRNPDIVELLARESEGNTFFMVEVVRHLAEKAGSLKDVGKATLPREILTGGMKHVIEFRLNRFDEKYQFALQLSAVIGRKLDLTLLQHLLPSLKIDEWLYRGTQVSVLVVEGNDAQFAHDKLREAVLAQLSETQTQTLHARVAEGIEALYDSATYAEILMNHWRKAGNTAKEADYLEMVAERLTRFSARYDTSEALLKRGLAIDPKRAKFYRLLGTTYRLKAEFENAVNYFEQAQAHVDDEHQEQIWINLGLAASESVLGKMDLWEKYAQQAHDISKQLDIPVQFAAACNSLGQYWKNVGDYQRSIDYHQQALEIYQNLDDNHGLAITYDHVSGTYNAQGDYEPAHTFGEKAVQCYRKSGDRRGLAVGLTNLGTMVHAKGDIKSARGYWEQALEIFRDIGDKYGIANTLNYIGLAVKAEESFEQSRPYQEEALKMYRDIGDQLGLCLGLINMAVTMNEDGLFSESEPYIVEALKIGRQIGHPLILAYSLQEIVHTNVNLGKPYQSHLKEALKHAIESSSDRVKAVALIATIHSERKDGNAMQAAIYANLALNYAGTPGDQLEFVQDIVAELEAEINDDENYHQAVEISETLSVEDVLQSILESLEA